MIATSKGIAHRGATGDSSTIIYIPFAIPDSNTTAAVLAVRQLPSDTLFSLFYPQHYQQFGFDTTIAGWNARNVFQMFAEFDYTIFGHTDFLVTDGRIFGQAAIDTLLVKRKPALGGRGTYQQRQSDWIELCVTYIYEVQLHGFRSSVTVTESPIELEICTTYWNEAGMFGGGGSGPGNGGGGNGGGGGGGSTGGSRTLSYPCIGAQPRGKEEQVPCGSGWVWVPVEISVPPPEPIDTLLKKYAELVNIYRDSYSALCETEHNERFFNIVKLNGQLDIFRVIVSQTAEEVNPNYNMLGGRVLKGQWHYHSKYLDGTPGSWPSGGDVTKLFDKPKDHIMIIDTYDARYALVVENENQMTAWKNIIGNGPNALPERVYNSVLNDQRAYSTGSIYVNMTKEKIFAALGSSSSCGIGLYEATASNGTVFIKINLKITRYEKSIFST